MSGGRRSELAVEADRRAREQRVQIGGEVRASRQRRRWTQDVLARRSGISRHVIGRIERGITRLDIDALQRIGVAFGRRPEVRFARDPFEAPADAGHLAMQELLLRLGRRVGYTGSFELATRPVEPWRSIDVVLAAVTRRTMVLCECWNSIGDIGAAVRSTSRKAGELEALAMGRFGADATVGTLWVVRATARNKALVARYPEVFASRFPGSSRRWMEVLVEGTDLPSEPGLIWSDIAADRVFEWRQRSRPGVGWG